MTLSDYATHVGVSLPAVRKRIANGGIPQNALKKIDGRVHPMIDSVLADKAWAAHKDPAQALAREAKKAAKAKEPKRPKGRPPGKKKVVDMSAQGGSTEQEVDELDFSNDTQRYTKAKTSTEELRSRKLELEIMEREGALLEAEEVRKQISKLVTETKEAILNVPAKIGPELLGCTELVELEMRLMKALNEALDNLSRLDRGTNAQG